MAVVGVPNLKSPTTGKPLLTRSMEEFTTIDTSVENAADKARMDISHRILKHEEAIRLLKSEWNNQARVSRLPPEVLSHIFGFVVSACLQPSGRRSPFNFSHVSQFWRDIAIKDPTLWNTFSFSHLKWIPAMLERSKSSDLTIQLDCGSIPMSKIVLDQVQRILNDEISRIREIDLQCVPKRVARQLTASPRCAPRLQILRVFIVEPYAFDDIDLTNGPFSGTTLLRHLESVGCRWDWKGQLLSDLTVLKIHQLSRKPELKALLSALGRMPALETLDLYNALPLKHLRHSSLSVSAIALPKLRTLRLNGCVDDVAYFLGHLRLPSTATMKLTCNHVAAISMGFGGIDNVSAIMDSLALKQSGISCRALSITARRKRYSLKLLAWKDTRTRKFLPQDSSLGLQWIHLVGKGSRHLLRALIYKSDGHNTPLEAYRRVSFPALRSLWIEKASFNDEREEAIDLQTMEDCFIERYERGAPLDELVLRECTSLSTPGFDLIRDIVVDVDWNGPYEDSSDEDDELDDRESSDTDDDF